MVFTRVIVRSSGSKLEIEPVLRIENFGLKREKERTRYFALRSWTKTDC